MNLGQTASSRGIAGGGCTPTFPPIRTQPPTQTALQARTGPNTDHFPGDAEPNAIPLVPIGWFLLGGLVAML